MWVWPFHRVGAWRWRLPAGVNSHPTTLWHSEKTLRRWWCTVPRGIFLTYIQTTYKLFITGCMSGLFAVQREILCSLIRLILRNTYVEYSILNIILYRITFSILHPLVVCKETKERDYSTEQVISHFTVFPDCKKLFLSYYRLHILVLLIYSYESQLKAVCLISKSFCEIIGNLSHIRGRK